MISRHQVPRDPYLIEYGSHAGEPSGVLRWGLPHPFDQVSQMEDQLHVLFFEKGKPVLENLGRVRRIPPRSVLVPDETHPQNRVAGLSDGNGDEYRQRDQCDQEESRAPPKHLSHFSFFSAGPEPCLWRSPDSGNGRMMGKDSSLTRRTCIW